MMSQDTDMLSDAVMNALWFCDFYRPTCAKGKEQPEDEISASKLARESVFFMFLSTVIW
jgi:hypothetical protein